MNNGGVEEMKYYKIQLLLFGLFLFSSLSADEGMWFIGDLTKQTQKMMRKRGAKLNNKSIYSEKNPSLKDAVVSFGGFCSGVMVSEEGLLFTNHHCGFEAIHQLSSLENNYIEEGYVAKTQADELPCPDLYVSFLISTENVTSRILSAVRSEMTEAERSVAIDSVIFVLQEELAMQDSNLIRKIDSFYEGSEYWLSTYQNYYDVRLVFSPPSSIGKFGWDSDNWMWPRHTGDFSVFRVYADAENQPADFFEENQPYQPRYVAPISIDGYQEGSFCMTMGYPGNTDRYLSSFGIEETLYGPNEALIEVRGVKQGIWKEAMNKDEEIQINYASKYAKSSNYWKNAIGKKQSIKDLSIIEKRKEQEEKLQLWIENHPVERIHNLRLLTELDLHYLQRREVSKALAYFGECFMNGPELIQLSFDILNFDYQGEDEWVKSQIEKFLTQYSQLNLELDKEVFIAMLKLYKEKISPDYHPYVYQSITTDYEDSIPAYVDDLYEKSIMTSPEGLNTLLGDSLLTFYDDPAISLVMDFLVKFYELNNGVLESTQAINQLEREYNRLIRESNPDYEPYPDANFTMRMSFGTIAGYSPADGMDYSYYTTVKGVLEKVKRYANDPDFQVSSDLLDIFKQEDFGVYANERGEMPVCFISDNDITGGNSGSAMFNGKGELLGLAFDGNWEAMSSDYLYEPLFQRCIGVDVRYILFLMKHSQKANRILDELNIK